MPEWLAPAIQDGWVAFFDGAWGPLALLWLTWRLGGNLFASERVWSARQLGRIGAEWTGTTWATACRW